MTNDTKLTAVERAQADLDAERMHLWVRMGEAQHDPSAQGDMLDALIRKAQDVILARLKTRTYEVDKSYENSGADSSPDLDAWDDAVEAADPSEYDVMWKRGWQG